MLNRKSKLLNSLLDVEEKAWFKKGFNIQKRSKTSNSLSTPPFVRMTLKVNTIKNKDKFFTLGIVFLRL